LDQFAARAFAVFLGAALAAALPEPRARLADEAGGEAVDGAWGECAGAGGPGTRAEAASATASVTSATNLANRFTGSIFFGFVGFVGLTVHPP
jgi:hypothetical protein